MGIFGSSSKRSHEAAAVITGAGSGIGAAFATELARRGGRVVCSDIDETAAQATADAHRRRGRPGHGDAVRRRSDSTTSSNSPRRRRPGSAARRRW